MRLGFTKGFLTAVCGLFLALVLLALPTNAQFRAAVQGVVTDSNGAVVSGATVTLTNNETSRSQQTTTSDSGFYRFSNLAPGTYTLNAEQQGFKKGVVENFTVAAENVQGVDIILTTGSITETVTVTGDAEAIETENANVQKSIDTQQIRSLPQVGRDPYELLRLAPGVLGTGARGGDGRSSNLPNTTGPGGSADSIFQTENQVQISASGQRLSANNFQIDGVSVNSLQFGGAAVITPNQESVKEVLISSSSFSAEDGRNSGAQIKVVSQNGTNEFHGSALFKYNDPGWNAFNKFYGNSLRSGRPSRVEQRYKQFGGAIGGPIVKDNLFFFFSYEGYRNNSNNTALRFTETEQFRKQVITARQGGKTAQIFGLSGIEPRIIATIPRACTDFFPNPTQAAARCRQVNGGLDLGSLIGGVGTYVPGDSIGGGFDGIPDVQFAQIAVPRTAKGNQYNFRFDYNLKNDQIAFVTYITQFDELAAQESSLSRPNSDVRKKPLNYALTGTWIRNISSTILNEFRANFTSFKEDQVKNSGETNFGIPRIEIEGPGFNDVGRVNYGAPWGDTSPGIFDQRTFEIRDALTTIFGNHALKFGAEYRREISDNDLSGGARPLYTFNGLINLANDAPVFELIDIDPRTGGPANAQRFFRSSNYAFYAQDDWKALPNLTLNFGLRYEYFDPVSEKDNRLAALVLGEGERTLLDARVEFVDKLTNSDRNNFGPRLGFAYSPNFFKFLENKAVIRGGFGIYYNRVPNVLLSNTRLNTPNYARIGVCCGGPNSPANARLQYFLGSSNSPFSYPVNTALAQGINPSTNGPVVGNAEIWGSERNLPNAEVYKYSIDLQYQLPYNTVASIGYEGNQARNLIRILPLNVFFPRQIDPGFDPIFWLSADVNSNYNGMNLRIDRRFAQGFQISANYRFSKSLDQGSFEGPAFEANQTYPIDQSFEKGPSSFDVRHNFNLSGLYVLPFFNNQKTTLGKVLGGFEISGIVSAHTGFPWTPLLSTGLRSPSGSFVDPIRPILYRGGQPNGNSNSNFLRPNGIFPGGGSQYFGTTAPPNNDIRLNTPAIGRNVYRGPKYFSVDMSLAKRFGLPGFGVLGESPNLEIRFNFFNIFNQLNLSPFIFGGGNTRVDNSSFGEATGGLAGRVVEFQARFRF